MPIYFKGVVSAANFCTSLRRVELVLVVNGEEGGRYKGKALMSHAENGFYWNTGRVRATAVSQLLVGRGDRESLQIKVEEWQGEWEGVQLGSSSRSRRAGRDRMLYKLYDFYLRASFELEPNKMPESECGWGEGRQRWLMGRGGGRWRGQQSTLISWVFKHASQPNA